ncbi:MAG: UbiD family decarboxylase [Aigarchaeota archaeon]|nr:UbiD family decarboxylase [Aigarchaeota archaeon]MDW8092803.1 UbiD family decarboxylase [Nitrososphaerota archaeon]
MTYKDLRDYLATLEEAGLLFVIERPIVKETELMPLVRLQFRGLQESDRKGFLFKNVIDVTGKRYDAEVCVGVLSASLDVYSVGLECKPDISSINEKWARAIQSPVPPVEVQNGPVHEVVVEGSDLERDGLNRLPIPVELPGYSCQIRTTTAFITKDVETGVQNAGTYSGQIFGPRKILWEIHRGSDGFTHLRKAAERGMLLDAAIVIGGPPYVQYAAAAKLPYGLDEFAVAGGLAGTPIEVVRCKTVDLLVPAYSEIVIEGKVIPTEYEPQPPFGEYTGYMAVGVESQLCPVMEVTAITMRRRPIFQTIISQMPPSESSKMRQVAFGGVYTAFLRDKCNIRGVKRVVFHEASGSWQLCVIQLEKNHPLDSWSALYHAASYAADIGKLFIAVDTDIDPADPDSVIWALSFRMQPHRDIQIVKGKVSHLDPSATPPGGEKNESGFREVSAILIDATMKWPYPPTSLPKKEYMERALQIWREVGLPELKLKEPWYGYNLGAWTEEYELFARLITMGKHYEVGKQLEKRRTTMRSGFGGSIGMQG